MWLNICVYTKNKLTNSQCICAWKITFNMVCKIIHKNWMCKTYHNRKETYKHTMKQCIRVDRKFFPWEFQREMYFYFSPEVGKCVFKLNGKSFEYFFMCQIMGNEILIYVELKIFKFGKDIHKILIQNLWFYTIF